MDRNKLLSYAVVGLVIFLLLGFFFFKDFLNLLWKSLFSFNGFMLLVSRIFTFLIVSKLLYVIVLLLLIFWLYKSIPKK